MVSLLCAWKKLFYDIITIHSISQLPIKVGKSNFSLLKNTFWLVLSHFVYNYYFCSFIFTFWLTIISSNFLTGSGFLLFELLLQFYIGCIQQFCIYNYALVDIAILVIHNHYHSFLNIAVCIGFFEIYFPSIFTSILYIFWIAASI